MTMESGNDRLHDAERRMMCAGGVPGGRPRSGGGHAGRVPLPDGVDGGHAGRMTLPVRKRMDHRGPLSVDVSGAWYFITICAEGHKPWVATKWPAGNDVARSNADDGRMVAPRLEAPSGCFAGGYPRPPTGVPTFDDIADVILREARENHVRGIWRLALFLVMPDHLHFIVHVPDGDGRRGAKSTVRCGDDTVATNSTALDHNSTVDSAVGRSDSTLQGDWTKRLPPALQRLVAALSNETLGSQELCRRLNLKSRGALRQTYIQPAIKAGLIDVVGGKTHSSKRAYRVACPVGCENDAAGWRGDGGRGATALPGKTTREDA